MKRVLYLEKYIRTYREFCELSTTFEKISAKKIKNCQKSSDRLSKKMNRFLSLDTSLLSSVSFWAKHADFSAILNLIYFNVFFNRVNLIKARASSSSTTIILDFSLSRARSRFFHDASTQKRPRRTHSAYFGCFSIIIQKRNNKKQFTQTTETESSFLIMLLYKRKRLRNLLKNMTM